jgi:hypothetical protein
MTDLFAAAREGGAPTDGDRARMRTEIAAKLATAAVAGLALKGAAKTVGSSALTGKSWVSALVTKTTQLGLATKLALAALLSGAAVVAMTTQLGHRAASSRHELSPGVIDETTSVVAPVVHAPAAATVPPPEAIAAPMLAPAVAESAPPLPSPSVSPRSKAAPAAVVSVTAPAEDTTPAAAAAPSAPTLTAAALEEEVTLLRRGKSDLERGDPASALAVVTEYQRRFPSGTLAEEAHVVRVLALCASGRKDEGRALATRLAGSVAAERTRAACAGP